MRKCVISAFAVLLTFGSVFADAFSGAKAEELVIEETEAVTNCFNSVYLGLGIGWNHIKNKGKGLAEYFNDANPAVYGTMNKKTNRFMGTLVLGAGKVFNENLYFGADAMFDFMKNKKKSGVHPVKKAGEDDVDKFAFEQIKNKGFAWNAGVRLGYVMSNGILVYGKFGGAYAKSTQTGYGVNNAQGAAKANVPVAADANYNVNKSCNKMTPLIAFGLEKVMCNGLSVRGEVEYDFKAKKRGLERKDGVMARLIVAKHIYY